MGGGLIVSNKYGLACLTVPKCASTTLISVFADLHGQPGAARDRQRLDGISGTGDAINRHADILTFRRERLAEVRAAFPDYAWFSVVRNPYGRLISNYANKINRFAARFRRGLYLRYKVVQALGGPGSWRDVRLAMTYLTSRIGYGEFVATLEREGTDWDPHFRRQSILLQLPQIRYDRLLRMETLQEDLAGFLREAGLPQERIATLGALRRLNRSPSDAFDGTPEELALRPAVYRLYRDDFEMLDYGA